MSANTADGLGVGLAWCTDDVPAGVTTAYDALVDDPSDDPGFGLPGLDDADWDAAQAILATSDEFLELRGRMDGIELVVVLRDLDEAEIVPWPEPDAVETIVLRSPAAPFRELDSRVAAYVETVVALATEVDAALSA